MLGQRVRWVIFSIINAESLVSENVEEMMSSNVRYQLVCLGLKVTRSASLGMASLFAMMSSNPL
jgi:hypothetical protein